MTGLRIGQGYDLHRLVLERDLIIGGVKIPHDKGLLGHSDADVLCHAIIDALFGAVAAGDIGRHFPDTDPAFKGADSIKLLQEAGKILTEKGFKIVNIDSTIIIQKPKMAPHTDKMRENIAQALNIRTDKVSVKAKTNEGADSTGKEEAIQAFAVVLVEKN
ncbi:MAG: 2-C-methyl-D-erythritol 2,4-cyclodiphosphate synthase [Candidatus Gastranaerophilales bacterium]|nr:2-C-methyl-D-erythritol 2,4-cyclodiphosphate synthase [Candidatus Gastranaerophilales bacterium]